MPSTPQAPPLLCEDCGYDIQALQDLPEGTPANTSANCPECGRPVHTSLPEHRHGIPLPPVNGKPPSWFASAKAILTEPRKTFARVRIDGPQSGHFFKRSALPRIYLLNALLGFASTLAMAPYDRHPLPAFEALLAAGVVSLVFGLFGMLVFLVIAVLEAFGLRQIARVHRWRVDRATSETIVHYASVGWVAGLWVLVPIWIAIFAWPGLVSPKNDLTPFIALATLLIPLFWFELLCYLGIRRCKFANPPRIPSGL